MVTAQVLNHDQFLIQQTFCMNRSVYSRQHLVFPTSASSLQLPSLHTSNYVNFLWRTNSILWVWTRRGPEKPARAEMFVFRAAACKANAKLFCSLWALLMTLLCLWGCCWRTGPLPARQRLQLLQNSEGPSHRFVLMHMFLLRGVTFIRNNGVV